MARLNLVLRVEVSEYYYHLSLYRSRCLREGLGTHQLWQPFEFQPRMCLVGGSLEKLEEK